MLNVNVKSNEEFCGADTCDPLQQRDAEHSGHQTAIPEFRSSVQSGGRPRTLKVGGEHDGFASADVDASSARDRRRAASVASVRNGLLPGMEVGTLTGHQRDALLTQRNKAQEEAVKLGAQSRSRQSQVGSPRATEESSATLTPSTELDGVSASSTAAAAPVRSSKRRGKDKQRKKRQPNEGTSMK